MSEILLRGITWNHARGYAPLEATAKTYQAANPGVRVVWERRSLKEFEDFPAVRLAADYDLLVIDHPCIGQAVADGAFVALDEHLPAAFLADQAANSVGESHASYRHAGHQWALAIDAATPVACWREDLLARHGHTPPQTWDEVLSLARTGLVEVPAAPINCLMTFFALCLTQGETPCASPERVVADSAGRAALAQLRELLALCDPAVWTRNPIASLDLLASAENRRAAYCLFPYGYSNYSRPGYAAHPLTFGDLPRYVGARLRTVLGGTGLAVSALRTHRAAAVAYAQYCAAPETQRGIYTPAGGQPGHRAAWQDPENNRLSHDYFRRTLPALDRAWLRPRHAGYLEFQEKAGHVVQAALRGTVTETVALEQLNAFHRSSLTPAPLRS